MDRPKVNKFVGSFYDKDEINRLLAVVRGTNIELAVLLASFYGLRRSKILGLKSNAIDFNSKTITIQHIVTQVSVDGTLLLVRKTVPKTKPVDAPCLLFRRQLEVAKLESEKPFTGEEKLAQLQRKKVELDLALEFKDSSDPVLEPDENDTAINYQPNDKEVVEIRTQGPQ